MASVGGGQCAGRRFRFRFVHTFPYRYIRMDEDGYAGCGQY